jgi:large-conductance mechanosensitive channel
VGIVVVDGPTKMVGVVKIITVKGVTKGNVIALAISNVSGEPYTDVAKSFGNTVVEARPIA